VADDGRRWEINIRISHLENTRKQRVLDTLVAVWEIFSIKNILSIKSYYLEKA
jgi:hypothetical protein